MYKKAIRNAVAGTAASGLLLVPTATTVSPQIANMVCQYPDSIGTTTKAVPFRPVMRKGQRNWVRVRVSSNGPTPRGVVDLTVQRLGTTTKRLQNGRAVFRLPVKRMRAGKTYAIHAKFFGFCRFKDSQDRTFVIVQKRRR